MEAVSCDELYLDCTQILETTKTSPLELATFLRKEIKVILFYLIIWQCSKFSWFLLPKIKDLLQNYRFNYLMQEKTQCPCSIGIGSNCLLARLATKKAKPDGQFYVEPGIVMDFMKHINISDVPGNLSNIIHN